jgi:hypothetical protein
LIARRLEKLGKTNKLKTKNKIINNDDKRNNRVFEIKKDKRKKIIKKKFKRDFFGLEFK